MASGRPHTMPSGATTLTSMSMGQSSFQVYNPHTTNGYYDSFNMVPMPVQMQGAAQQMPKQHQPQQGHLLQPQQQPQQQQQQQQSTYQAGSQSMSNQYSDDDYEDEEEDTSEVMIPKDDIETRLRVAQEAQDAAASEGSNGVFACPYCDKRYEGKHARSIWRRHLQDKHAIPLSQQPRRTRWDGDANRPKNAEERRQRMLESKRRWARKKRQAEKSGAGNGKALSVLSREDSYSGDASPADNSSMMEPQKKASAGAKGNKRGTKTKEPRPFKTHHLSAQAAMPPFADFGGSVSAGGGNMLWPVSGNGMFQTFPSVPANGRSNVRAKVSNGNAAPSSYTFDASNSIIMPQQPQQQHYQQLQQQQPSFSVATANKSPRKALAQIDTNSAIGRQLMRQSMGGLLTNEEAGAKSLLNARSPPMTAMDMGKTTPMNRFSQMYPTPPSVGDAALHDRKIHGKMLPAFEGYNFVNHAGIPLLSPPASQHTNDSSPSFSSNSNALQMTNAATMGKRNSVNPSFAPIVARTEAASQRSPSDNPFSLDRHKISPSTSSARTGLTEPMQPPMSASRLTSVLDNHEHKLSPLQNRRVSDEEARNGAAIASPLQKSRRLPPLVKTPMRGFKIDDLPTPSTNLDMMGSHSIRRLRSTAAGSSNIDSWKGLLTPTEEHGDRMMGFTPLNMKSAKYSTTRGLASVSRPGRDNDQFSSPQHLNLTQSLGLAPHSTSKGGVYGSVNATPCISGFLNANSPWPESVMRPMATSAQKRGRDSDEDGNLDHSDRTHGDDDEDDEEGNNGVYMHETPSRPAKHRRPTLLGSAGRGDSHDGSSSSSSSSSPGVARQIRLGSNAGHGDETVTIKPISFKLPDGGDRAADNKPRQSESVDSDEALSSKSSLLSNPHSPSQSDEDSEGQCTSTDKSDQ